MEKINGSDLKIDKLRLNDGICSKMVDLLRGVFCLTRLNRRKKNEDECEYSESDSLESE